MALALAGTILLGYRLRVSQYRRRTAQQEAFARELIASQEHERQRIAAEDIDPKELILGVSDLGSTLAAESKAKGVHVLGVKKACEEAVRRIHAELKTKG